MRLKLACVLILVIYHLYCEKFLLDFKHTRNNRSHIKYRRLNEIPVIFLVIIILAVIMPV